MFTKYAEEFYTHTHARGRCSSSSFIVTLSLIRRTACARAQFSECSSTTNAHSETEQMAVCCQNLTLSALNSCSALSMLVGALFKKFGLFLNTPPTSICGKRVPTSSLKTEYTNILKIQEPPQNCRRQKPDVRQYHTKDPQILDATVRSLVAWTTWLPGFVHRLA